MVNMDAPYEFDEHESMLSLEDCANIDVEVVPEITTTSSKSDVTGRWSAQEHDLFLEGLKTFGRNWKLIASLIPHRSVVQIRTHAQKHFQKLEKLNKPAIGKDGEPTGSPRANRSDSMTDSMFFGDQSKGIEFGLGGNGLSAPPKKVRAMTLSSAELSNGSSMDGNLRASQASAFNYHDNSLFGDVIRSHSVDLMNGSHSPTDLLNSHSKRNISDMMGSNGTFAMSMGGYGESGSVGLTISPFYSGIGAKPSGSPRAYNRKGNGAGTTGKSRVNRSKSFEELSRSEHKRSPAVDSDGQEDNSNLGIPIASRKHASKSSPRAPRKTSVGLKRSQSSNGVANQGLIMDGFPSEVSPTSVLGVSIIDSNWGGHFGMQSKANKHGVNYNSSNIGGGVDYSMTPCSMLPVLFPDFDDVVRSMEIEESGQLQYIEYKQHVPMHKPAPPLLSDDLCLSIIHEDMEFDDLTASCRELWGSGYNFIDNVDQPQDSAVNTASSGMDGQFNDSALLMEKKSVSLFMDSTTDSHQGAASNGPLDSYNYQQVFVPLPNTLDDGCLTDGLEQLFY
jgi:SHAQKYF class myb-like DNA-binding protein